MWKCYTFKTVYQISFFRVKFKTIWDLSHASRLHIETQIDRAASEKHAAGFVPAVSGVLPADVTAAIAAWSGTAEEEAEALVRKYE